MGRKSQALLYAGAFLALTEYAVRSVDVESPNVLADAPAATCPVVFLLGTSRARTALGPRMIERELTASGVSPVWVANVSELGVTNVGLLSIYRSQLRPYVGVDTIPLGFVGIEVRCAAMNDAFMLDIERAYLARNALSPIDDDLREPAPSRERDAEVPEETARQGETGTNVRFERQSSNDPPLYSLFDGPPRHAAQSALLRLRLAHLREERLRPMMSRRQAVATDAPPAPQPSESYETVGRRFQTAGAAWAVGNKGWRPLERNDPRDPDRVRDVFKQKYLLERYRHGGVQTDALRHLVREIKADGLTPFLFVLPVTSAHRELFNPGDYRASLELIHRIARAEGIRCFDFDTGHNLKREHFFDGHHLNRDGAEVLSPQFARRALQPLIANPMD